MPLRIRSHDDDDDDDDDGLRFLGVRTAVVIGAHNTTLEDHVMIIKKENAGETT